CVKDASRGHYGPRCNERQLAQAMTQATHGPAALRPRSTGKNWGERKVVGLKRRAKAEDAFGAAAVPVAHAGLFAAAAYESLTGPFYLTASDPQAQGAVAGVVDAAAVIL